MIGSFDGKKGAHTAAMRYIIVVPKNHAQLGLFNDLKDHPDTKIIVAEPKKIKNGFINILRRIHTNHAINRIIPLPCKQIWDKKIQFEFEPHEEYTMIYLDGALLHLDRKNLNSVIKREHVKNVLVLINSLDASSLSMMEVKPMISQFAWDAVYTFDPIDAKKYGYRYLGCCYYSMNDPKAILNKYPDNSQNDIYFTGGLKGGRDDMILSIFKKLDDNGIRADFHLMYWGKKRMQKKLYADKIHYFTDWMPYEKVLAGILRAKVILEILQEGQNGPSLRYYEAVCYNKKLLSNNPHIVDFPYYDPHNMRYFSSIDDIDLGWITEESEVNYNYQGDFSPVHMLELFRQDLKEAGVN